MDNEEFGEMDWISSALGDTTTFLKTSKSMNCWRWSFSKAWPRFATKTWSLSVPGCKRWSALALGESISGVLGWKMVWSKTVLLTKLSDFVLKRLSWKDASNSKSWRVANFFGREGNLRSGLLLLEISVVLFFLSSLSGLSITFVGSGSGWDLVEIILGARTIDFIFFFGDFNYYKKTVTTSEHYF